MTNIRNLCVFVFVTVAAFAQSTSTSLQRLLVEARQNNLAIKAAESVIQTTRYMPKQASALLIKANPGVFSNQKLVYQSTATQVGGHYLADSKGRVGCQTLAKWTAYPRFLLRAGAYSDSNGHKVTKLPVMSSFFTNKYLPYKC